MLLSAESYRIQNAQNLESPSLIYYRDIILQNIRRTIQIAGGPDRLWPHVKTHKMAEVVRLMMAEGIIRFKCATIAEAEMLAGCGATHVLLAYPLVGPNILRFLKLRRFYSQTTFWAIGDNLSQLKQLGEAAAKMSEPPIPFLVDVNMGTNRTGVSMEELPRFCQECSHILGLKLCGIHAYDGNLALPSLSLRQHAVEESVMRLQKILDALNERGIPMPVQIMGGTPTFPCHASLGSNFLSPGTCFIHDFGYLSKFPDLPFLPGAAILARTISHPRANLFTIDVGYKAIASDQEGARGMIIGLPDAKPVGHSEEHWVFQMDNAALPPVGTILYVIPTHICPTTALYPGAYIVSSGNLIGFWETTARNRRIHI